MPEKTTYASLARAARKIAYDDEPPKGMTPREHAEACLDELLVVVTAAAKLAKPTPKVARDFATVWPPLRERCERDIDNVYDAARAMHVHLREL